ncbi:M24 family metallopeptidase [Nocardiopsis alba]|uniref:M24 family metallopeptidase n=1 Tax=Nocardiopsis alba TaxID=53437 RepID=UPI000362436C|nr:M24 family metallopeptidase [Nocardiopsis alba]
MSHKNVTGDTTTPAELDAFRELQRLAYRAAEDVAASLEPGVTEREAARRIREHLESHGVRDWFHTPFAWFGDRTAFRNLRVPLQFFPTRRRLEKGMPFILDCAPVRDGYVADIGYSGVLGRSPLHDRLVDDLIRAQGYDNRHRVYPGRVIAHQVGRVRSRLPRVIVAGFGVRSLQTLFGDLLVERLHHRSPLWADGDISAHPATPGLWAVEPHIGFRDMGAKFEEILVVTEDDAFWLDDDLPHVRHRTPAAVPLSA